MQCIFLSYSVSICIYLHTVYIFVVYSVYICMNIYIVSIFVYICLYGAYIFIECIFLYMLITCGCTIAF